MGDSGRPETVDDLRGLLASGTSGFTCQPVPMRDALDWRLTDGAISHASGGFFSVVAVGACEPHRPHPLVLMHQPQSAFNGLLVATIESELHVLLQTRVEPGNLGVAQYGPTVQSTPANYQRVHGGKATPYLDFFHRSRTGATPIGDWTELDLGGRYLFKNKRLVCVEAIDLPPVEPNFVWVSASLVKKAVLEGAFVNTDLRSMLAVMPWHGWPVADEPDELGVAAHASLRLPVRPAIIGGALGPVGQGPGPVRLMPLAALGNWELNDYGLFELEPSEQGFDVQFFRVDAPSREVPHWTQPLLNSRSRGKVVLALTLSDGTLRALVNVRSEPGLSTGTAVFPSHVVLPGQRANAADSIVYDALLASRSSTLARTVESDEGGRFFQDESEFELCLVDDAGDFGEDFQWITLSELKCLLGISNACSIQLRCIASMLLALL
jgi:oxidase EvaA